jgi:hypothetical protein
MRWLHIYVSMFGLASILFFGVTGLTLNHPDWFFAGEESTFEARGEMDPKWLQAEPSPNDPMQVARFEIVEHLRSTNGVRGPAEFSVDDLECLVTFKGPGYAADATIDRETGKYEVNQTYHGFLAVINDLHKGRDTGAAWSVLIDVSAVLMTVISLTGLVLLFYLKLRRKPGLIVGLIGTVAVALVYWFGVP